MTPSVSEPRDQKSLPYGIEPHEIGFLILLGTALYFSQGKFWGQPGPVYVFAAAMLAAVLVLILRCREEWRQMPNKWFYLSLTAAWVALFVFLGNTPLNFYDSVSLPAWMFNQYISPSEMVDDGHGLLIPFVVLALYWWKRKELVAGRLGLWWPATGLVMLALLFHYVGFISQQQRLSVIGFFLGLYGLTGLAWGWHWLKASFFPFFLFVFCIPVGESAGPLTMPLRLLVARIVEIIAHLGLAPDLIREGTKLSDAQSAFAYDVAPACSGIHSLVALLALMTIYAFINFKAPWKRAVMMLVALPLAVLGNVIRLCFTVAVAEAFGQHAGHVVETDAGFVTFGVAIVCAFLVARWLEDAGAKPAAAEPETGPTEPTLTDKPATP